LTVDGYGLAVEKKPLIKYRREISYHGPRFDSLLSTAARYELRGGCPSAAYSGEEASLKAFLQNWDTDETTRYVAAFRDLNGDGKPKAII
jgi:hypothetical protein